MFAVPDLTLPEPAGARRPVPPATLIRAVAADPASWRPLIRYDATEPSLVRVPVEHPELDLWLRGWLPGQSALLLPPDALFTVVLGAIDEIGTAGRRTLRAGQTRVLGHGYRNRLSNRGEVPAVTLHAVGRRAPAPTG